MTAAFDTVKVFTATKAKDRESLGETITDWIRQNPKMAVVEKTVTQSSDNEFHCLSITLFCKANGNGAGTIPRQ
jgi:hypothetical protein